MQQINESIIIIESKRVHRLALKDNVNEFKVFI